MENKIITLLNNKMSNNLTLDEIVVKLGCNREEAFNVINFLENEGVIYKDKNNKYTLLSKTSLKKGIIKVTKRKGPIVVLEDGKEFDILKNGHGNLVHNDIVLIEPFNKGGTAKVVKVLNRVYKDYVGEVIQEGSKYLLVFKSKPSMVLNKKYPIGTKLLVDGKTNTIKSVIGHKDEPDILVKELLLENDFPVEFSSEYQKELEYIPDELSKELINAEKRNGRYDLRYVDIVTIDGEDTKDFDDAVCFYDNMLYVSIADTSYFINEGSYIDKEIIKRGISVYTPGMVNPMNHYKISNGICSLNPNEDRFTTSSITKFDEYGNIISTRLCDSIIRSRMKMTYEDVNLILEENMIVPGYEKYTEMLHNLYNFAMKQKNKMLNEGFLEFSSTEVKMYLEDTRVTGIKRRREGKAEELIEFIMLYHNLLKTSEFIRRGLPFIARNHGKPNDEKLTLYGNLLNQRGYNVEVKGNYDSFDIRKMINSYRGASEKVILDTLAIRAQSRAKYSAYNEGHFAIGQKAYATFSSPIRRLADYINNRIEADANKYGDKYAREKWLPRMESLARIATDSELRADKIERKVDDIKKAEYMSNYIGSKWTGIVSEVGTNYIKVLLPNMVYGKVYISPKEYSLSKDNFSLISNTRDERILVGDSINVELIKVNKDNGDITFIREGNRIKECSNEKEKSKKKIKSR